MSCAFSILLKKLFPPPKKRNCFPTQGHKDISSNIFKKKCVCVCVRERERERE